MPAWLGSLPAAQGSDGVITGGFHRGKRLDATGALQLSQAYQWQEAFDGDLESG